MINQLAIKNTVSLVTHSSKYIEKGGKPTTTWVESWFEKTLGRGVVILVPRGRHFLVYVVLLQIELSDWAWEWGVVEWHLHYSMRGMWQTISRHCSLRQRKRRENAYIKSLVLTVQASCCWIQTIEVSCLYFSTFLILILFSLLNYFLDRYHKYVAC